MKKKELIKILLGIPHNIQLLGFFKGLSILHDPKHPAPKNTIYFINENNFTPLSTKTKQLPL